MQVPAPKMYWVNLRAGSIRQISNFCRFCRTCETSPKEAPVQYFKGKMQRAQLPLSLSICLTSSVTSTEATALSICWTFFPFFSMTPEPKFDDDLPVLSKPTQIYQSCLYLVLTGPFQKNCFLPLYEVK